jgi:hypothetical protein
VQRSRNQIRAALQHLKAVVCASGVLQDDHPGDPVDVQLQRFDDHLLHAKGLAGSTRLQRTTIVRGLLSMTADATTPSAEELQQFLAQALSRLSVASGGITATAVRSYLRFRTVEKVFRRLQQGLGWRNRGDHSYPRIHDLRHTMAVRRLQRWREAGQSIDQAVFWLCTHLGHAKISDTYGYLSGIPELMDTIGARFERFVAVDGHGEA